MEAYNDDFFVSAPTDAELDIQSKPLEETWQVTTQKLSTGQALGQMAKSEHGPLPSFQHVGLKMSRLRNGGIKISNPKITQKILMGKGIDWANTVSVPYVISADLTVLKI